MQNFIQATSLGISKASAVHALPIQTDNNFYSGAIYGLGRWTDGDNRLVDPGDRNSDGARLFFIQNSTYGWLHTAPDDFRTERRISDVGSDLFTDPNLALHRLRTGTTISVALSNCYIGCLAEGRKINMFWFTKNRHAEKIAKFLWPYISHAKRMHGIDAKDHPFLMGLISGSCNIGFMVHARRQPNQKEYGDIVVRVTRRCFPDRWKEVCQAGLDYMAANNSEHARGSDAAGVIWGLAYNFIDTEKDPDLKRLKSTLPPYDESLARYGVEIPETEHDRLLMDVIRRIHHDISGGPKWNENDSTASPAQRISERQSDSQKSFDPSDDEVTFKDNNAAFELCCDYMVTEIKKGNGIAAIVLDAKEHLGAKQSVPINKDGYQQAYIKVASDDCGFKTVADAISKNGPKLNAGDLVMWVPVKFVSEISSKFKDPRIAWGGYIAARLKPTFSASKGWKVDEKFKD